jgi:predicted RNA-binding protein YlqC (UPF0109 family)
MVKADSSQSDDYRTLRDLVEYISERLVDNPDNVSTELIEGEHACIIELHVTKDDVGKVIGKGGQTAKALRKILSAAATKLKKKAHLEIVE